MPSITIPETMKASVFKGAHDIEYTTVPTPKIESPKDAILKIEASALCGTELHMYRGDVVPKRADYITGHEFNGTVVSVGDEVRDFKPGDDVLCTFTSQCGECWACKDGLSSSCVDSKVFGTWALNGGQAEYVRIPYADHCLFPLPKGMNRNTALLMSDIFPTGWLCVNNYFKKVLYDKNHIANDVILQLGAGPVGLCCIAAAREMGVNHIYVADSVPSRLEQAKELGAIPININEVDNVAEFMKEKTGGKGADAIFELVGNAGALRTAFDSVRSAGFISSIGYHHEPLPMDGLECYLKNISIQFGRCPVRSIFEDAFKVFQKISYKFDKFIDLEMPLSEVSDAYAVFDNHKARKIAFKIDQ
ncbi:alcohol dehydrogenase family protein [Cyberlindnera jadinii NRRL Y-1542]|uniref:GroES-like protein n=1 Tax=Cyberlindnera jadinii (strain ATCC 18201 / CBS 1600 / BCRC 20928 / JCM 3617 / NBRC 0987 / NRRL Y-1542) TaxID=983966 RepID=A0A1E4S3T7_CYBJN|nr:GroES-like protein [Cyberlindnera jadinii NRRL Y-1542]ODV74072.1 GroES-like protein [Cyberlindnera jadinii NRRL Y-1542]